MKLEDMLAEFDAPEIGEVERDAVREALEILEEAEREGRDLFDTAEYTPERGLLKVTGLAGTWKREVVSTLQADHSREFVAHYAVNRFVRVLEEAHHPDWNADLPSEDLLAALAMNFGWGRRMQSRMVLEAARWRASRAPEPTF